MHRIEAFKFSENENIAFWKDITERRYKKSN